MAQETTTKKNLSLLDAAEELELICSEVDNADEIDSHLVKAFQNALDNVETSVDKRIRFIHYAESMAKQAKEMRDKWAQRARTMEKALEWTKKNTADLMKLYPDQPFKGSMGSFKLAKNSLPSLETDIITTQKSFEIIESTLGSKLPSEYITFRSVQIIDKDKLKMDLLNNKYVPGASLQQGEHVRITLEKK